MPGSTFSRIRARRKKGGDGGKHYTDDIGNESVPKIIINDTIFFSLNCNQHFGNFTSKHGVLFDKIASAYFIRKICQHFSIGNGQPREPALCQLYRRTLVPYTVVQPL